MLKMVLCDLDGTLLLGQKNLSLKTENTIKELCKRGILFAVVSGRKLCSLINIFKNVSENIIFVACDGAFAVQNGKVLHKSVIDKSIIENLFKKYKVEAEYLGDKNGDTVKIIARKQTLPQRCDELIKINRYLSCVYEDDEIKEFVKFGTNKGTAIKEILRIFDIDKNDVIAFGDNYNDTEMLKLIPRSYAAKNAKPEIKRICKYSSDDVCDTIIDILNKRGEC